MNMPELARQSGLLRSVAELTRVRTVVAGICLCLIGARIAGGAIDVERVAWASVCVGLSIAFAQVVNDVIDLDVDRLQQRSRPLVRRDLTPRAATVLAIAFGVASLVAGMVVGGALQFVAGAILVVSWLYSAWWKSTVLFGNVVVATLASSPISFGAAAGGTVDGRVWAAQGAVAVFMAAFEVVKTGRDVVGDAAAGLTTVATRHGVQVTARVAGVLCVGFVATAFVPALLTERWLPYAVVMAPVVVLSAIAARHLLLSGGDGLPLALALLAAAWIPGIAAMVLL